VDDPTRILRAVRFEQRFDYQIGSRTLELLEQALSLLDRVSGDRLRHELNIILAEPKAMQMLGRLAELGVFAEIDAPIPWDERAAERIRLGMGSSPPPEWKVQVIRDGYPLSIALAYILWWLVMPEAEAKATAKRLRLPGWLRDTLLAASRLWADQESLPGLSPSQAAERFSGVPGLALYAVWLALDNPEVRELIHRYFLEWQHVQPVTTGHDLREMQLPPGPGYGMILDALRAAWLDGKIGTPAEEKELLAELVREYGQAG
jgi:tRNA nucleotidyltransferase (CCA-adding enzyme)